MAQNTSAPVTETGKLTFGEKVGFALGDGASNLFFQTFAIFLLFYYTDIVGLSAAAVGTMFLVTRILDTFTDPIMGAIADRTRSRWGRYRVYILFGSIPYGIIGFLMFMGIGTDTTWKLVYAYATYSAMMLAYTVVNVPYSSLMGVLTPSIKERAIVSSYRFVFAFGAGIIVSSSFLPLKNLLGGGDDLLGVRLTMAIFAVASVAMFMITALVTRERVQPIATVQSSIKQDVADLFKNVPWIVISAITILQLITIVVRESTVVFFFRYVMDNTAGASLFLMLAKVSIIAGIFANVWLMRHVQKRTLLIAYCYISAICYGGIYFVPTDMLWLMHVMNIVGSLAFGPIGVILWSMYGDCADYGEWKFGRRATGLVFSSSLFAIKFGLALGGAIPGWLLAMSGFVSNEAQDEAALGMIRMLMTVIPACMTVVFGSMVFLYPLRQKNLEQIESDLAQRKETYS